MIWVGIIIGALAIVALQGFGVMLTWKFEGSDDAGEAVGWWYAITCWPIWLAPYLHARRKRRRPHEHADINE